MTLKDPDPVVTGGCVMPIIGVVCVVGSYINLTDESTKHTDVAIALGVIGVLFLLGTIGFFLEGGASDE